MRFHIPPEELRPVSRLEPDIFKREAARCPPVLVSPGIRMKDEELIKDVHEGTGIMILPVCDPLWKQVREAGETTLASRYRRATGTYSEVIRRRLGLVGEENGELNETGSDAIHP